MRGNNGRARPAAFGAAPGPGVSRQERPADAERPAAQEQPSAPGPRQQTRPPELGEWPEAGGWPDAVTWRQPGYQPATEQIPPGIWDEPENFLDQDSDSRAYPKIAGAPATAGPRSDGRFAAEWSRRGVTVRRNSLLHGRRRAGGGAMARKATPEDGLRPAEFAADEFAADWAVPDGTAPGGTGPGGAGLGGTEPGASELSGPARRQKAQWSGGGGRWLIWTLRAVVWAVLIVIGFRGVASIVASVRQSGGGTASSTSASSGFPTTLGEAFALQFGAVYLSFSPATATQRAAELTPFIPVGADPQFGWNGSGSQQLQSEQVASVSVRSAHQATITLLARVNSGLIELGVPVYAAQGGLVVSAEPAMLPVPGRVSPPAVRRTATDRAAQAALARGLPGFFAAYASGNQQALARYLAPGAAVTGLGGAATFGSVGTIEVPAGGATRQITVTVTWQFPALAPPPPPPPTTSTRTRLRQPTGPPPAPVIPPGLQMTYQMTIVRRHGAWFVKAIAPSALQPEAP
jgi:Conjugative transposon protein TcpC